MKTFGDKIKKILSDNNYSYRLKIFPQKEKCLKNGKKFIQEYDKIVIYAGRSIEKSAQRRSRKLVAWKNPDGKWEGNLEIAERIAQANQAMF